ncbi:MAG: lysophospholipid acyltransferase family protein [Methylobacter sp.]
MSHLSWIQRQWIAWDYGVLLPLLARLPLSWGRCLAAWRGLLYAWLKRDWRQLSFQDQSLYRRTQQTLGRLLPEAGALALTQAVAQRYQMQSIEEWEAACMIIGRDISQWPVSYEGLDGMLALLQEHPRVVFLTGHFGSSILGTVLLQRLGLPVLGMSSNIVDDPRVHPRIGRFYRQKYAAMGRYLNGGQILDRQGNASKFVRFLQRGGAVVIVGDLPADPNESALVKPFLGVSCGFAPGAVKLAKIAQAPLMGFVCEFHAGIHHLRFSAPGEDPYTFIGQAIRRHPSAWWAADVLPLMMLETSSGMENTADLNANI